MAMQDRVIIRDTTLRDGLQLVVEQVPAAQKIKWLHDLVHAGVTQIEVSSYVPPKVIAQFSDVADVVQGAMGQGVDISVLVPNLNGARRAFDAGLPQVNFVLSASEAHSKANTRKTRDAAVKDFEAIVAERTARNLDHTRLSAGIATAFGCTMQGAVDEDEVVALAITLRDLGADEILVADTVGYGNPAQVRRILGRIAEAIGPDRILSHFHDTRGLGLANVVAALDVGVRRFDSTVGGLGGCPFAPGATGNIDTEDLAFMLQSMGYDTGVDIPQLVALQRQIAAALPAERVGGCIARAGLPINASAAVTA
ncbi:hydroxymethylglutaryl-CoA lyase [Pseudooceanicola sp.]|uniref:hydroxymethylglutaryl-CoA lyase n=1 Tax=Pseudooceanicola sp. TaxID=1914328 RepID=UPI002627CB2C|nr:hydroxymethylglutaryl-CoA lyase [Pseudooceanicola sp.]MDF1857181.1 hydroxymethylglutaryl-CoA lyase [Pseudooceanicola sp.]